MLTICRECVKKAKVIKPSDVVFVLALIAITFIPIGLEILGSLIGVYILYELFTKCDWTKLLKRIFLIKEE